MRSKPGDSAAQFDEVELTPRLKEIVEYFDSLDRRDLADNITHPASEEETITITSVTAFLTGRNTPKVHTLRCIHEYTGLSYDELMEFFLYREQNPVFSLRAKRTTGSFADAVEGAAPRKVKKVKDKAKAKPIDISKPSKKLGTKAVDKLKKKVKKGKKAKKKGGKA